MHNRFAVEALSSFTKGGRPLLYNTPEEMAERVSEYFAKESKPTMAGVCIALGMTKQSFWDYGKREEFSDLCKTIRQLVEHRVEGILLYGRNPAGSIFWLKNHADYVDKREIESSELNHLTRFVIQGLDLKVPDALEEKEVQPDSVTFASKDDENPNGRTDDQIR